MRRYEHQHDPENNLVTLTIMGETEVYETISEEEFAEKYIVCETCGKALKKTSPFVRFCESNGKWYCRDCVNRWNSSIHQCHENGKYYLSADMHYAQDSGNWYSKDSNKYNNLFLCDSCENYFEYEDSVSWDGDRYLCNSCYDEINDYDSDSDNVINDYHTMKDDGDYDFCGDGKRSEVLHIGYELEIDSGHSRYEAAEEIANRFDRFLARENDGSLNNGFEMISQPATVDYHLSTIGMENVVEIPLKYLFKSNNAGSCGFHTHLDKLYFGNSEEVDTASAKMIYLFEKFWDELLKFSRRNAGQIHWCGRYNGNCNIHFDNTDSDDYTKLAEEVVRQKNRVGRYHAVNLSNSDTIEIRLWRGSLNVETLKATLLFTERIALFCKTKTAEELQALTFEELLGDNETILSYWNRVKDGNLDAEI